MITQDVTGQLAALIDEGIAEAKAGNRETAIAALTRAVTLEPHSEIAWLWLASLYTELSYIAQCLQHVVTANEQAAQALQAIFARMQAQSAPANPTEQSGYPTSYEQAKESYVRSDAALEASGSSPAGSNSAPTTIESFSFEELKRRGVVAAKGGRAAEAREYLVAATEKNDTDAEAWYWLSTVVEDVEDKQIALENVLTLDPFNALATAAMEENAARRTQDKIVVENTTALPSIPGTVDLSTHGATAAPARQVPDKPAFVPGKATRLFAGNTALNAKGPDSVDPTTGQPIIAGRYRVLHANDTSLGPEYTVWDLKRHTFNYLRPVEANTEGVADQITYKGKPYALELLRTGGMSLRALVEAVGCLPSDMVAQYGQAMLRVVAEEHAKGPVLTARKFVTPDTVAIDAEGHFVLEPSGEQFSGPKPERLVKPFLPGEQTQGAGIAPTSDIFAVGSLLFFMLTGTPPPSPDQMPKKQGETLVPDRFEEHPSIPAGLAMVLATAMQPSPDDRYPAAADMSAALAIATGTKVPRLQIPVPQAVVLVAMLAAAVLLGWGAASGKLSGLKLENFLAGAHVNAAAVAPTALPVVVVEPTPVPPPPLAHAIISGVDSHSFPTNRAYISALDGGGVPVSGLTQGAVKLKENGIDVTPNEFIALSKTTDPISVIIALDTSEKMSGKALDDAKTAIHIFTGLMQPGDHLALITFGGSAQLAADYTLSQQVFLQAVDGQEAGDKRAIKDVFGVAANLVAQQRQGGYTALIIVTNGDLPKSNSPDMTTMMTTANQVNLPVYFVALNQATYPADAAIHLAALTGGQSMVAPVADAGGAAQAIKRIEQELHNIYKLTYESPVTSTGVSHTIEVTLTQGDATMSDKHGYQIAGK